jgi:hypothetical protein
MAVLPTIRRSSGKLGFADNQVVLSDPRTVLRQVSSSVLASGFDDIDVAGNQLSTATAAGAVFATARIRGASVRVRGNRIQEAPGHVEYSAIAIGWMATATSNQSTHCLIVSAALPAMRVNDHNLVLGQIVDAKLCDRSDPIADELWSRLGSQPQLNVDLPILIGSMPSGPPGPTLVTSPSDFKHRFPAAAGSELERAVIGFFANGGSRMYALAVAFKGGIAKLEAALAALTGATDAGAIAMPGYSDANVRDALVRFARDRGGNMMVLIDGPLTADLGKVLRIDTPNTIGVFPHLKPDGVGTNSSAIGAVLGVAARTGGRLAGEVIRGTSGVWPALSDADEREIESRGYIILDAGDSGVRIKPRST